MLTCTHCGSDNSLGIVFCRNCGRRLPAEELVREDWEKHQRKAAWRRRGVLAVQVLLAAWIVGCLALALRPRPAVTVPSTREDALHCRFQLNALSQAIRLGQSLAVDLKEEELNAYLRHAVLGNAAGRSGVVRVLDRRIHVLWHARPWGESASSPVLSFEATLLPSVRTGMLRITGARMGRLALVWPFRGIVEQLFLTMAQQRLEWPLFRSLRITRCEPGVLTVETAGGISTDEDMRTLQEGLPLDPDGESDDTAGKR